MKITFMIQDFSTLDLHAEDLISLVKDNIASAFGVEEDEVEIISIENGSLSKERVESLVSVVYDSGTDIDIEVTEEVIANDVSVPDTVERLCRDLIGSSDPEDIDFCMKHSNVYIFRNPDTIKRLREVSLPDWNFDGARCMLTEVTESFYIALADEVIKGESYGRSEPNDYNSCPRIFDQDSEE